MRWNYFNIVKVKSTKSWRWSVYSLLHSSGKVSMYFPSSRQLSMRIKVPLTPKYFFHQNESLHLLETHRDHFFHFLTNPAFLWASKHAKNKTSFVHNQVGRGLGLLLIWHYNLLCMHFYKELIQGKSVCDVKSVIDPLPFWLGNEQKMLGFSQVEVEAYKMAGFDRRGAK